jgi:hypothetical protein
MIKTNVGAVELLKMCNKSFLQRNYRQFIDDIPLSGQRIGNYSIYSGKFGWNTKKKL